MALKSIAIVLFALFAAVQSADLPADPVDPRNITEGVPLLFKYVTYTTRAQWQIAFSNDLRGVFIFHSDFSLKQDEELKVYDGFDTTTDANCVGTFYYKNNGSKVSQTLTKHKGHNMTIVLQKINLTPTGTSTTTPNTASPPTTTVDTTTVSLTTTDSFASIYTGDILFIVTSIDETHMNDPDLQGNVTMDYTVGNSQPISQYRYPGVEQIYHFYPADRSIQLVFFLINETALGTQSATLTVYRGADANVTDSTLLKLYRNTSDFENNTLLAFTAEVGEPISVRFNYPKTDTTPNNKLGFYYVVARLLSNSTYTTFPTQVPYPVSQSSNTSSSTVVPSSNTTGITPSPNSTDATAPTGGSSTTPSPKESTTTSSTPFVFTLMPIILAVVLQFCQALSSP